MIKGVAVGNFTAIAQGPNITPAVPCCNLTGGCCAPAAPPSGSGPGAVGCPSSNDLSSLTALSLTLLFPGIETGIGAVASIGVDPISKDWNYAQITESLVTSSNSCPASWGNLCAGSATFTVGEGGQAEVPVNGVETLVGPVFPGTEDIFYDQHTITSAGSLLNSSGINSCSAVCTQTYSCNGSPIGNRTITYSFIKALISGTPVTSTETAEQ